MTYETFYAPVMIGLDEPLKAAPMTGGHYRVASIPFLADSVALGDVITLRRSGGKAWLESVVSRFGNATVTVRVLDRAARAQVLGAFAKARLLVEEDDKAGLIAASASPSVAATCAAELSRLAAAEQILYMVSQPPC